MLEHKAARLVELAVDTAVGWGRSEAAACAPPTKRLAARHRWAGAGGRVLKVSRQGFGLGFQRITTSAHVVVDLDSSRDEIVRTALDQCGPMVRQQADFRARAACAGISAPLNRDGFLDLRRLNIDIAAARALSMALGPDAAVRSFLRDRLSELFDHGPSTEFFVHGFAVFVPFNLNPLKLAPQGRLSSRDDHWCGHTVQLSFLSRVDDAEIKASFEDTIRTIMPDDRPVLRLEPWPCPEMKAAIERRSRRLVERTPGHYGDLQIWRATVEHRLVSIDEAFG